jgi:PAT family beta-lactamase induction signal transducer AmpG
MNQILNKFLFSTIRIILCFAFSGLIILFLTKTNFISKQKVNNIYLKPITNFINRYGKFAFLILLLIGLYRIADVVMGVVANIFYLEKGFNIKEIATYSKFFGVFATILGGFIGGIFALNFGTMKALFIGALIAAGSNLLFALLAASDPSIKLLITVITADNISSGFAGAAFVVYLTGLTSIKFTATQYALFSSIMLFIPKLIAGYSGSWVDAMGYTNFFTLTALLGVPVLFLIIWISKVVPIKN